MFPIDIRASFELARVLVELGEDNPLYESIMMLIKNGVPAKVINMALSPLLK